MENGEQFPALIAEDSNLILKQDAEVINIIQSIDVRDQISLLEFGKETADELSIFSEKILNSIKAGSIEESSVLLKSLGKIMDRFDKNDFVEDKGLLSKIFKKSEKFIQQLFDKYQSMGREIDKVFIEIKKYESEMKQSTQMLEGLYMQNVQYYQMLQKYVVAGETKVEQLKAEIAKLEDREKEGRQLASFELNTMRNAVELLEQRTYDLRMAGQVAFQTAPQILMLQRGNTKLIGKINSAFIITIPIFKSGIINAIAAKRQSIVAKSMDELDKRTNELLLKNAQNIAKQSVDIAKMSGEPSIKTQTIEQTWEIIVKGMQETKDIEEENKRLREEGKQKIMQIQESFKKQRK